MKRVLLTGLLLITLVTNAYSQATKVTAANTALGALNGAILGLGAMGLSGNTDDLSPLRIGVGVGTLYGLGMGIYDITMNSINGVTDTKFGVFHSSEYSAMIPMYNTLYGGATGSLVGMSIALINGTSIQKGFVNGGSVGLYAGFIFGLTDVLYFSKTRTNSLFEPGSSGRNDGFVTMTFGSQSALSFGKLDYTIAPVMVSGNFQNTVVPVVQLAHYRHQF